MTRQSAIWQATGMVVGQSKDRQIPACHAAIVLHWSVITKLGSWSTCAFLDGPKPGSPFFSDCATSPTRLSDLRDDSSQMIARISVSSIHAFGAQELDGSGYRFAVPVAVDCCPLLDVSGGNSGNPLEAVVCGVFGAKMLAWRLV